MPKTALQAEKTRKYWCGEIEKNEDRINKVAQGRSGSFVVNSGEKEKAQSRATEKIALFIVCWQNQVNNLARKRLKFGEQIEIILDVAGARNLIYNFSWF